MAEVVGLDGKRVEGVQTLETKTAQAARLLRELVEEIESGKRTLENWIFVFEQVAEDHPGEVLPCVRDSGLSAEAAVYLLEAEKLRILYRLGVLRAIELSK
jgi:hypothetical protein